MTQQAADTMRRVADNETAATPRTSMGMKNEGKLTQSIEAQTAKLPSGAYLGIAVGAMAVSAGLMLFGQKQVGNFIGQWAPTILIMGLYNKIVKLEEEIM